MSSGRDSLTAPTGHDAGSPGARFVPKCRSSHGRVPLHTAEVRLIALAIIFTVPCRIWRVSGTEVVGFAVLLLVAQLAFNYLGLDANSHRPEDLAAAEALLTRVRPCVRYFHWSQCLNDLASGEVCLPVGWSGGIERARHCGATWSRSRPLRRIRRMPTCSWTT